MAGLRHRSKKGPSVLRRSMLVISPAGFSGQMHGAVMLDPSDEVIRPAIIWCDQRSEGKPRASEEIWRGKLIRLTCESSLTISH